MTRRELEVRCRQLEVLLAAAALDAGGDLVVPATTLERLDSSTRYTLTKDERGVVFSVRQPEPAPLITVTD